MLCFAVLLFGCTEHQQTIKTEDAIESASIEPVVRVLGPREKQKFNNWIAREMYEQIYGKRASPQVLHSWSNVLTQGGSLEGVYHGMILSTDYSALERGAANVTAVRFFAEESALLQLQKDSMDKDAEQLARKIAMQAMKVSLFTLKRELGERILGEVSARKENRPQLATFYGKLAYRWADKGVSFGFELRNNKDEEFHSDWAKKNSIGMIQWELLNRVHRIFNQFGGIILDGK